MEWRKLKSSKDVDKCLSDLVVRLEERMDIEADRISEICMVGKFVEEKEDELEDVVGYHIARYKEEMVSEADALKTMYPDIVSTDLKKLEATYSGIGAAVGGILCGVGTAVATVYAILTLGGQGHHTPMSFFPVVALATGGGFLGGHIGKAIAHKKEEKKLALKEGKDRWEKTIDAMYSRHLLQVEKEVKKDLAQLMYAPKVKAPIYEEKPKGFLSYASGTDSAMAEVA